MKIPLYYQSDLHIFPPKDISDYFKPLPINILWSLYRVHYCDASVARHESVQAGRRGRAPLLVTGQRLVPKHAAGQDRLPRTRRSHQRENRGGRAHQPPALDHQAHPAL